MKDFKHHQNNRIHLEQLSLSTDTKEEILYDKINYGRNIKTKNWSTKKEGKKINQKNIHIEKTKSWYILIVTKKIECLKILPDLFISSSTTNTSLLGKLVIMACVLDETKSSSPHWQLKDYATIKSCKPNILSTSNHHGSVGYYALFGNKCSFDKIQYYHIL